MLIFDQRRHIQIEDTADSAVAFAVEHWIHSAKQAIQQRGFFAVALSGGSTPKAIYQKLILSKEIDWSKIFLFWGDERAVPPTSSESNYKMAMESFQKVPIPLHQIFRMHAEENIEANAKEYEEKIRHHLGKQLFDLVMLGMGEDGHTASLFPGTKALTVEEHLVCANEVPQLKTDRMTLSFSCINQSKKIAIYALGAAKKEMISKVLEAPILSDYPSSNIGTVERPALWILDKAAGADLPQVE